MTLTVLAITQQGTVDFPGRGTAVPFEFGESNIPRQSFGSDAWATFSG